jgi:hypothetical protein
MFMLLCVSRVIDPVDSHERNPLWGLTDLHYMQKKPVLSRWHHEVFWDLKLRSRVLLPMLRSNAAIILRVKLSLTLKLKTLRFFETPGTTLLTIWLRIPHLHFQHNEAITETMMAEDFSKPNWTLVCGLNLFKNGFSSSPVTIAHTV